MVDIQSLTADIRQGKKDRKKKIDTNYRAKIQGGHKKEEEETTGQKYNGLPYCIGQS